jgi:hypothetical protein
MRRARTASIALAVLLARSSAYAEDAAASAFGRLSKLEREKVQYALKLEAGALPEIEEAPEGKAIESIEVIRVDVLDDSDPVPNFARKPLNALHTRSRPAMVERELLVHEGKPFVQADLDETERNLRRLSQFSFAVALPLKSASPGKVKVLVLTKDVWSLRLSYDFKATGGGLDSLTIKPTESNVAGLHHIASLTFQYQPESYLLGGSYTVPRFGDSTVSASANAGIVMNNARGEPEGALGGISIGQPLYTTRTPWAWNGSASFSNLVTRRYSNGRVLRFGPTEVPSAKRVPFEYRQRNYSVSAGFTRSFGWEIKNDLSLDFGVSQKQFEPFDLSAYDAKAASAFRNVVPTSDTRVGPTLTYRGYTTKYHRITDFETLAIQEDYRLGHDVYLRGYPVLSSLGSSRTFLGVSATAQYTVPLGNGMARVSLEGLVEADDKRVYDASVEGHLRVVSPTLGFGRLISDVAAYGRPENYLRTSVSVGGESRLRGFPSNAFTGKDFALYSLEFRSRPLYIASLALGGAVFYEAGDVFSGLSKLRPKQSAGFGFRLLIPQFNRIVFRGDIGFALSRPLTDGTKAFGLFFGFEQAFAFGTAAP